MMSAALKAEDLVKVYGEGEVAERVLGGADLCLDAGERCLLMGPSGSGKTTLLSCLGCLLTPTSGRLEVAGRKVNFSSKRELEAVRRQSIGFVFQHAQLLPFLSAAENVAVVARNAGLGRAEAEVRVARVFERLGMTDQAGKLPGQMSGGQRQRVAIARGLVHEPAVVLADEPTAALDWKVGRQVVELLVEQVRETRAALLVVTHDKRLEGYFDRRCEIAGGVLVEKGVVGER